MSELMLDDLSIYRGKPYQVTDKIIIYQPNIDEIADFGEQQYFSVVQTLCSTSSDMKSNLADMGLDWEKVEDWQMCIMLYPSLKPDQTKLIFGEVDLSRLKPYQKPDSEDVILADIERGIQIDEMVYLKIVNYLRKVHGFKRNHCRTNSEFTHQMLIEVERDDMRKAKNKPYKSFLLSLISSVKARQAYDKERIFKMQIFEFMDEVNRLQIIVNTDALLQGSHSGMMDTKKIKKDNFNWMRDIIVDNDAPKGNVVNEGTF